MTSNRPFCRALSLLCVCLVLLPALLSTPAAAASKKRIQSYHYPTNTLIGENRPFCRALSLLCVCLVLLPALLSTPAAAASKKRIQSYHYPTNTLIGEKLPYNQLSDEKGNPAQIEIKDGQYTLITYWASWCPDCQQEFEHLPQILPVLKEYGNVQWYLVNRTDGTDETLASARTSFPTKKATLPKLKSRTVSTP